jgi:hypothetical protein
MTKHGSTLQDKLARSLDQANRRDAAKPSPAPAAIPAERKCKKCSFSIYAPDLARLDAIRSFMATRGQHISESQAVRLALRTAALTPEMDKLLDAMRSEDGRGKW